MRHHERAEGLGVEHRGLHHARDLCDVALGVISHRGFGEVDDEHRLQPAELPRRLADAKLVKVVHRDPPARLRHPAAALDALVRLADHDRGGVVFGRAHETPALKRVPQILAQPPPRLRSVHVGMHELVLRREALDEAHEEDAEVERGSHVLTVGDFFVRLGRRVFDVAEHRVLAPGEDPSQQSVARHVGRRVRSLEHLEHEREYRGHHDVGAGATHQAHGLLGRDVGFRGVRPARGGVHPEVRQAVIDDVLHRRSRVLDALPRQRVEPAKRGLQGADHEGFVLLGGPRGRDGRARPLDRVVDEVPRDTLRRRLDRLVVRGEVPARSLGPGRRVHEARGHAGPRARRVAVLAEPSAAADARGGPSVAVDALEREPHGGRVMEVGVVPVGAELSVRHPRARRGDPGRGRLALGDRGQRRDVRQVRRGAIGGTVDVVFHRGFLAANAAHVARNPPAPAPSARSRDLRCGLLDRPGTDVGRSHRPARLTRAESLVRAWILLWRTNAVDPWTLARSPMNPARQSRAPSPSDEWRPCGSARHVSVVSIIRCARQIRLGFLESGGFSRTVRFSEELERCNWLTENGISQSDSHRGDFEGRMRRAGII